MKARTLLAVAVIVAPLVAAAQSEVSRATITGTPVVRTDRLHVCADRNDRLWDRAALIGRDRQEVDREGHEIARLQAQLERDHASLDSTNAAAVADYNARSASLNARVAAHNRQVRELNGAVALLNSDSSEMVAYCNRLYVMR